MRHLQRPLAGRKLLPGGCPVRPLGAGYDADRWAQRGLFAYRRRGRRVDPGPAIPPADRKEIKQSSNRLDAIFANRCSDCHQPHDFAPPLRMPSVGFAMLFGSEVGPGQIG